MAGVAGVFSFRSNVYLNSPQEGAALPARRSPPTFRNLCRRPGGAAFVPVIPIYNWAGVYVGVNSGFGFGQSDWGGSLLI